MTAKARIVLLGLLAPGFLITVWVIKTEDSLEATYYAIGGLLSLTILVLALARLDALATLRTQAKVSLVLVSLLISLGLAEAGLRLFFRGTFLPREEEKNLLYQYDARLGWFPIPGTTRVSTNSRVITVHHNSEGFRGPEFETSVLPVITFFGDSFVWGFDVEAAERFTDQLQARHPEWAIYNLGVSGYGTDQELLLLQDKFDKYRPQVVFLVICAENDADDNRTNLRDEYYKPYFITIGEQLVLRGCPVRRGERAFFREHEILCQSYLVKMLVRAYCKIFVSGKLQNPDPTFMLLKAMQNYLELKGARFGVGFTGSIPGLQEFLDRNSIPSVDLSTTNRYGWFGFHWTPDGHQFACDKIEALLTNQSAPLAKPLEKRVSQ